VKALQVRTKTIEKKAINQGSPSSVTTEFKDFKQPFQAFSMTFLRTAMHILNDISVHRLYSCRHVYIANSQVPFQVSNQAKTANYQDSR